jgi:hypothetical protein
MAVKTTEYIKYIRNDVLCPMKLKSTSLIALQTYEHMLLWLSNGPISLFVKSIQSSLQDSHHITSGLLHSV